MSSPRAQRRRTRPAHVGGLLIGAGAPVSVQSMTKTDTTDADATLEQVGELADLGCDLVRCAVPNRIAVQALKSVVERSPLPVVADVHFDYRLALACIRAGAHGVRVNPGNMRDREGLREVYALAARAGVKVRIGVNSGSIRPRQGLEVRPDSLEEDTAELMVKQTLDYCNDAEESGLANIVISLKASDVPTTLAAYRLAASRCDYPFHVGVTAAGPADVGVVRSAVGIGALLAEGIGDTVRVSLTGPPHDEVHTGLAILEALGLREPAGPRIISCPTCARCEIDLCALVDEVRRRVAGLRAGLRIAVMGCVVNGPGEAAEADLGIAGGRDFGYLFRNGHKLRKVAAAGLADALVAEACSMCAAPTPPEPESSP
jgi:(E)-4-hydroxy-3-methylbut-2-enyl-diphosphate synthase